MAGTVDMGVMPGVGLVLYVRRRDGDTTLSLFGGFIDGSIFKESGEAFLSLAFGDCCCQRGL